MKVDWEHFVAILPINVLLKEQHDVRHFVTHFKCFNLLRDGICVQMDVEDMLTSIQCNLAKGHIASCI